MQVFVRSPHAEQMDRRLIIVRPPSGRRVCAAHKRQSLNAQREPAGFVFLCC